MLGHPDNLPAAIACCIVARPVFCEHALNLRFYAVLQAKASHMNHSIYRLPHKIGLCRSDAKMMLLA